MPANGRRDLIRHLKVSAVSSYAVSGLTQFCACLKKKVETKIGTIFLNKICTEFFLVGMRAQ